MIVKRSRVYMETYYMVVYIVTFEYLGNARLMEARASFRNAGKPTFCLLCILVRRVYGIRVYVGINK